MTGNRRILFDAESYARRTLAGDATGHDYFHSDRVRRMALRLAKEEKADPFIVELVALLHDIADSKFHGAKKKRELDLWLRSHTDEKTTSHVLEIIDHLSFKGAKVKTAMRTIEGKVVQDADRLDALGAIGIARCFATSARLGCPIHDPSIKIKMHSSFKAYRKHDGTAINHFYEKLLLLKDLMNTRTARRIAAQRQKVMEKFLEQFLDEWSE